MSAKTFLDRFSNKTSDVKLPNNVIYDNYGESDHETEERLENIFKTLDRNGNGRIDIQELTVSLKDLGMSHQYAEVSLGFIYNCSSAANTNCVLFVPNKQKFLKQSDSNRSGDVALNEFINYVREHEKNLQLQFSHLDRNKDGKLISTKHLLSPLPFYLEKGVLFGGLFALVIEL